MGSCRSRKNSDGNPLQALTITDENENGKLIATGEAMVRQQEAGIGGGLYGDGDDDFTITVAARSQLTGGALTGLALSGGTSAGGKDYHHRRARKGGQLPAARVQRALA
ncbi:MAG: hypothetical protein ACLU3U_13280 [Gallintestinimicrobium sp.]